MGLAQGIPRNPLFKMYILHSKENSSLTTTWGFVCLWRGRGKSQNDVPLL